jgi:hypothetical protein
LYKNKLIIDSMKGLAVTQVVLLILGIVVLAIIGYLIYSTFIAGGPTVVEQQCKSKFISVCSNCKAAGWTGTPCAFPYAECNTTSIRDAVGAHPDANGNVQQTECNAAGVL